MVLIFLSVILFLVDLVFRRGLFVFERIAYSVTHNQPIELCDQLRPPTWNWDAIILVSSEGKNVEGLPVLYRLYL